MSYLPQQIDMTRGDARQWSFAIVDENASAVSLASHGGLYFTAKRSIADPDASAIFQKILPAAAASAGGFSLASAPGGTGSVQLAYADTAGLEDAIVQLSYDLQFVDVGGNRYTVAAGKLTVRPDVTLS